MSGCKKTFFLRKINLSNHKSYEKEIKKNLKMLMNTSIHRIRSL